MKRRDLRVTHNDKKYPFATGSIVEALQMAGVTTDDAIAIARDSEKFFRNKGERQVKLKQLCQWLYDRLVREVNQEAADRFAAQSPPIIPLMVVAESGQEAFSRRRLVNALENAQISLQDANRLAGLLQQQLVLEGRTCISRADLDMRITQLVEDSLGLEARLRYEGQVNRAALLWIVEADKTKVPFSRGIMAQSLMLGGISPDVSHYLAKVVELRLWRSGQVELTRESINRHVHAAVTTELGEEEAKRFELLTGLRSFDAPLVIMIGGAAGVGKSTLAAELAYRLGISRIVSSDTIRHALRSLISVDLSPTLHASSYTAWLSELMPDEDPESTKPKPKRVVRAFQRQVSQLSTALKAVVERNIDENASLIVEGIHMIPGMHEVFADEAMVIEMVLDIPDEDQHRHMFSLRDRHTRQRRSLESYLSHFTEIRFLQNFIISRAEAEEVPVIDVTDFDHGLDEALTLVLDALIERDALHLSTP